MVSDLLGSDLKAYISEATRTWHVQHEFSDCRCDIVFVRHKDNFLTKCAAKIKSEQFSEFGSGTIDPFPKRHRLVHNGGFPTFDALYCGQNMVSSTEILQNLGYKVQSSKSQSLKPIQKL